MKNALLIILILSTIEGFGQQWNEYEVDSIFTITIPDNYQVTDTLGQRIITAQIDNGLILLTVLPNKGANAVSIQDQKDLADTYKGFQIGLVRSQNGELIKQEIIDKNGIKLSRFSFRATMAGEKQIRHCLSVFLREKTYAVTFWELESMTDEMAPVREKLFSSVKFPSTLTIKDQMSFSIEGSQSFKIGYLIGQILGFLLIIGLVIMFVVWISKRAKKRNAPAQQKP